MLGFLGGGGDSGGGGAGLLVPDDGVQPAGEAGDPGEGVHLGVDRAGVQEGRDADERVVLDDCASVVPLEKEIYVNICYI